ncbi:hypothetical protein U9655_000334 [Enterobacter asburiae]
MSTITKEWLQKAISQHESMRDEIPFGLDEDDSKTLAAFRIALASLELERGMIRRFDLDMSDCDSCGQDCGADMVEDLDGEYVLWDEVLPHLYRHDEYTAPRAPVSVPDDVMAAMQKVARIRLDLNDFDGDKRGILDCLGDAEEALIEVVNRRAAMLQGAENAESTTTMQNAPALDSSPKIAESTSGNSPVIPDGGEHGFCQKHPDTRRLTHPYIQLMTYPPRPSIYCPKCDPNVTEWIEMDKKLRIDN